MPASTHTLLDCNFLPTCRNDEKVMELLEMKIWLDRKLLCSWNSTRHEYLISTSKTFTPPKKQQFKDDVCDPVMRRKVLLLFFLSQLLVWKQTTNHRVSSAKERKRRRGGRQTDRERDGRTGRQTDRIREAQDALKTLISAFVLSRIDYCNSLFAGCPKQLIHKLQKVQNNDARLICRTHISRPSHSSLASCWTKNWIQTAFPCLWICK